MENKKFHCPDCGAAFDSSFGYDAFVYDDVVVVYFECACGNTETMQFPIAAGTKVRK